MKPFPRSRSFFGLGHQDRVWPLQRSICTRCLHSLNRAALQQRSHPTDRPKVETPGKAMKRPVQRRRQHSAAGGTQEPEENIIAEIVADGPSEDSLKKESLNWESAEPPRSKIRERLRAWEQEQRRLAELDPAIAADFDNFKIGTELDLPDDQELQKERARAAEEGDDDTPYEHQDLSDGNDQPEFIGGRLRLRPGDIVSNTTLSHSKFEFVAVFCRQMGVQNQFYTLQGEYAITDSNAPGTIFHPVSGIIEPEMLEPILQHLPKTELNRTDDVFHGSVPRSDSQRVHNLLANFSREAQNFYQKHRAVLDNVYDDHADEIHRLHMSNDEVSRRVLGRPDSTLSPPERFAVHSALFDHIGIKPVRLLRDAEAVYIFRPATAVRRLQNVVNWARLYQEAAARASRSVEQKDPAPNNPLYSFVEKARRLILKSRTMRKPTTMGTLGPSLDPPETGLVEVVGEPFNQNDQMILELLIAHYAEQPQLPHDTLASVAALIIRAIGAYPKLDLGVEAGYMALQELGVIAPWTNFRLSTWMLGLPNIGFGADLITDELYQKCVEPAYQTRLNELPDTMADLRRDWGDLPVFCIDSKTTTEVDDGISIEVVPDSADLKWLHVHVADPSAFVAPSEMIAKYARRTLSTTYTGEHHVKMFPGDAPARFSLAPNRPAMTISALCSTDGSLKDCRITPSIVRNVFRLTPLQLQEEFSVLDVQEDLFMVGRPVSKVVMPDDESWREHLGDIYALRDLIASQLRRKRNHPDFLPVRRGLYGTNYLTVNVENAGQRKVDLSHSRHWRGDPTISLKLGKSAVRKEYWELTPEELVSKDMVSEIMQLTGEAVALWCRQRKIPIVYNGTKEAPDWPVRRLQHMLRTTSSVDSQATNYPTGSFSATPFFHHNLGVEQYARATSPLRRFSDLICHWQINTYLRNQADANRSDAEPPATGILPFTKKDIEDYLTQTVGKEFRLRKLSQHDNYHWKMHALFRAFYFKEAELPDPLFVRVFDIQKSRSPNIDALILGIISPFDFRCMFDPSEEGWELEAEAQDIIAAKIVSVNPNYAGLLHVVAIGPPKRRDAMSGHDSAANLVGDGKKETATS